MKLYKNKIIYLVISLFCVLNLFSSERLITPIAPLTDELRNYFKEETRDDAVMFNNLYIAENPEDKKRLDDFANLYIKFVNDFAISIQYKNYKRINELLKSLGNSKLITKLNSSSLRNIIVYGLINSKEKENLLKILINNIDLTLLEDIIKKAYLSSNFNWIINHYFIKPDELEPDVFFKSDVFFKEQNQLIELLKKYRQDYLKYVSQFPDTSDVIVPSFQDYVSKIEKES